MAVLPHMFNYNLWANLRMVEICQELNPDQLQFEMPGAYGPLLSTLMHIIRSEGFYIFRLSGTRPWETEPDWAAMSIDDLPELIQLTGDRLIDLCDRVDPTLRTDFETADGPGFYFNWTVLLQALYHGIEHRTQVKMMLTQLGIDHPDLDSWDYRDTLAG